MRFFNNRTLILSIIVVSISIIYIAQLFNLQIVNGKEYREKSEKRMLRTETISAPRGLITDCNDVILATSQNSFNVLLYRVGVDVNLQNEAIKKLIEILERNGDKIYSTFPINDSLDGFSFYDEESEKKWKKNNNIDENLSFDETIDYYIKKYGLEDFLADRQMKIKIIEVKYEGNVNSYSLSRSAVIAKDISDKSNAQIEESGYELYGVEIVSVPKRYYPQKNLFSHILGYVGKIGKEEYDSVKDSGIYTINSEYGKLGVELTFEKYLKGTDGVKKVETDREGNISSDTTVQEAVTGKTLRLTLDYRLQKVAQEALESTIEGIKNGSLTFNKKGIEDASAGAVVVLNCQTGEVLAMANYPNYDNNLFINGISNENWNKISKDPLKPMYNRAISNAFSPGSAFKMLVGIAGLQTGSITVTEKYTDPGIYPYGHKPMCWKYSTNRTTHGTINVSGAIKGSCNCFFYEVGRRIGISEIVKYAKMFGLGEKTGIELPEEATGNIAGSDKNSEDGLKSPWYLGDTLSAAIGQSENQFTVLQLANYISAIANGGKLNKVTIIKSIKDEHTGEEIPRNELEKYSNQITGVNFEERDLNINREYIDAIKEGMLSVTTDTGGTAAIVFKNSNIQVAGKTGTAERTSGSNDGIFVGFAPYDNPKIAVATIIEHGGEGTYTANVVKPIMEEYFNIVTEEKANEKETNVVENELKY